MIPSFVITALHETDRQHNLALLKQQLPELVFADAIYPSRQHIPFLAQLQHLSLQRTGWQLNKGEIGVLLSNRKIWRHIVQQAPDDTTMYLILESDSVIHDVQLLRSTYPDLKDRYDLFFWGAWSGHMKLERSSKEKIASGYTMGRPHIKTVYGAYGYCINRKAARYLLKSTARISHPVDQYKYFIREDDLRLGGIVPELITHLVNNSTIGHPDMPVWRKKIWLKILDIKNTVICFFK